MLCRSWTHKRVILKYLVSKMFWKLAPSKYMKHNRISRNYKKSYEDYCMKIIAMKIIIKVIITFLQYSIENWKETNAFQKIP